MKFIGTTIILTAIILLAACNTQPAPAGPQSTSLPADIDVATAASLRGREDVVMLDVRTPEEYAEGHIPGVVLIPLAELPNRLAEVPKDKTLVVTCRSGNRSAQAAQLLRQQGYGDVHNMLGGIGAWQEAGYPVEK
jgi:rhodanese-related sulfurtransferase